METMMLVAVGAIVLVAFVVVLRRLARDNEPVKAGYVDGTTHVWVDKDLTSEQIRKLTAALRTAYAEEGPQPGDEGLYAARGMSGDALPPSWHETERLRKKHREQERARKKRQKNRKGGR